MKKLLFGIILVLSTFIFNINYVGASANDFTISNFSVDYYLDKGSDGSSNLKTVEVITAEFPSIDQNHGIERAIPMVYDKHPINLTVTSVKDQEGSDIPYTTSKSNNNLVLRIGNAGVYVHGSNTYVITYTQNNVTRFAADTNKDEFYWNVNGNQWSQMITNVTARLHLGQGLSSSVVGGQFCYYGKYGVDTKCSVTKSGDIYTANVPILEATENMTIAIGFSPKTFKAYVMTFTDFMNEYFFYISIVIMFLGLVAVFIVRILKGSGVKGRGIIVAEYLPPKDVDVAISSIIADKSSTWVSAMYVDLAVRHNIKIVDSGAANTYTLEYIKSDGLNKTEIDVVKSLFGENPQPGNRYTIVPGAADATLADKTTSIYSDVSDSAKTLGYFNSKIGLIAIMITILAITIAMALGLGFVYGESNINLSQVLFWIAIFNSVIGFFVVISVKPLSLKGRELFDYLKGLELYIKIAEEDRIKVLQSPQGSARVPINTGDAEQMVVLYERVLPYAILFGQEKKWADVIGKYYEQTNRTPDWYSGNTMFNAMVFSSAMNSFSSSAVSNSYVAPSSSSSGGSSGGGFSGGGGGGGGGGGW